VTFLVSVKFHWHSSAPLATFEHHPTMAVFNHMTHRLWGERGHLLSCISSSRNCFSHWVLEWDDR